MHINICMQVAYMHVICSYMNSVNTADFAKCIASYSNTEKLMKHKYSYSYWACMRKSGNFDSTYRWYSAGIIWHE